MLGALYGLVLAAHADEGLGTLRMLPNDMLVPEVAAQIAVAGTLDPRFPVIVEAGGSWRGIPGALEERAWLGLDGSVGFDALAFAQQDFDPVLFTARLTPWRYTSQSKPIVAAQDLRVAALSLGRDRPLDVELTALLQVFDWSGGLYLPANRRGDIDARVVIGARALGVDWRRYCDDPDDFLGASLGGLSGELVYGRRFGGGVTLTGHLGARADWLIGSASGFSALSETGIWLGGVLEVGPHHALRLFAGTRTSQESTSGTAYVPTLTLAWRATW